MKVKVNGCVDCGLPCGTYCSFRDDSYEYYCDNCNQEEELFYYDGFQLCISCIKKRLEKVN